MVHSSSIRRVVNWLAPVLVAWCALPGMAGAELRIEITQGIDARIPVAVVPFAQPWRGAGEQTRLTPVIVADLRRSGWFDILPRERLLALPTSAADIDFRDWRLLDVNALLIGAVETESADAFGAQFELYDVLKGERLAGARFSGITPPRSRRLAHHIADQVYQSLTGVRGVFNTRIAYVTNYQGRYHLRVADSDGENPLSVLSSGEPMLSPAWSPDGRYLAYVAFDQGRPAIFRQELASGSREKLFAFPGINGAPAWSPDGRYLAVTLSKDGNPEIYIYDLASRALRRLTHHYGIDTEASWMPDGKGLLFTSDRSGGPQIYRISITGGKPQRLTFDMGAYNARARVSPDGRRVALVNGEGGRYRIAVLDLQSGLHQLLSDGPLDESPSFAPNGQLIIYTTTRSDQEMLATVSVDGKVRQTMAVRQAKVREPAWSPFFD